MYFTPTPQNSTFVPLQAPRQRCKNSSQFAWGKEPSLDSPARLFVESLNNQQFTTLNVFINDPWGTEVLRLACEVRVMREAYLGCQIGPYPIVRTT